MALLTMYDAAFPPSNPPPWDVVAGYVGGDTPNIWTLAEWNSQPARYRLPIFTRSNPDTHSPTQDAAAMLAGLANLKASKGCLTALDFETAINGPYVLAYDKAMVAGGHPVVIYGSESFVLQNPKPSGGYWVAKYDAVKSLPAIAGVVAKQYANDTMLGKPWDGNVISDQLALWDTQGGVNMPVLDATDLANVEAAAETALHKVLHIATALQVPGGQLNDDSFAAILVGAAQNAHNDLATLKGGVGSANSFLTNEQRSFNNSIATALAGLPAAVVAALPAGPGVAITSTDVEVACETALVRFLAQLAAAVPA